MWQLSYHPYGVCKLTLTIRQNQTKANSSHVINVKTALPVIVVVILQIITVKQNITLKQLKGYTKMNGSSAATKCGVNLHSSFTVRRRQYSAATLIWCKFTFKFYSAPASIFSYHLIWCKFKLKFYSAPASIFSYHLIWCKFTFKFNSPPASIYSYHLIWCKFTLKFNSAPASIFSCHLNLV